MPHSAGAFLEQVVFWCIESLPWILLLACGRGQLGVTDFGDTKCWKVNDIR